MKVAVHAGQLLQRVPGGIGRYVEGLFAGLPRAGVDVVAFAAGDPSVRRSATWPNFVPLGHPYAPLRYELWHRLRAPRLHLDVDVVHAPSLAVPPPGRVPLVVTVNDIAFRRYPELFTRHGARFHEQGLRITRREARAVIVPSEFTRDELVREGFDSSSLFVAHHGVDIPPAPAPDVVETALRRVGVRRPFVLTVGTLEPRKNFTVLARAVAQLREERDDVSLVRVGPPGWGDVGGLDGPGMRELGAIDDGTLDALYRAASVCALPSRYEGFGLPILEAMARGCPVAASDVSSLPEVVDGAGLLLPPDDVDAWRAALGSVIDDAGYEAELRQRSVARARRFDWSNAVEAHVKAYEYAVAAAGRP
ncbi:MAG: glycosyltransferase family 4 protein [Actinobacteria bacterium]|nr:glycosyltransferase family 4 protein [Actinomycetota bacterium]